MDAVNEFLKNNYKYEVYGGKRYPDITKRMECMDGFSISVQASSGHYCQPRENEAWPYREVELGYPSEVDNSISNYAEDPDTNETVFGYVPIDIVNQLVEKHGGIKE